MPSPTDRDPVWVYVDGVCDLFHAGHVRFFEKARAFGDRLVVGLHSAAVLERLVSELAPLVDAFLTDTFAPDTGAAGATGRTHDWSVSRRMVELSPRPVILAGGLTAENVRRAIEEVRPAGVDVHTGVEDASGRKSRDKVLAFVAEAEAGFRRTRARPGR